MSIGFSAGDLIGAANVTYHLIKALREYNDAGEDYRLAIEELGCMQQALIRVSCLVKDETFSDSAAQSARYIVLQSMGLIESYLERTKKYERSLGSEKAGRRLRWRKVGWTLFKAEEMRDLRNTLHGRLTSLNVLLAAERMSNGKQSQCLEATVFEVKESGLGLISEISLENSANSAPPVEAEGKSKRSSIKSTSADIQSKSKALGEPDAEHSSLYNGSNGVIAVLKNGRISSLPSITQEELKLFANDQQMREKKISDLLTLLYILVGMGKNHLRYADSERLMSLLGELQDVTKSGPGYAPLRFQDAVGRKFMFPWHLCKTWKGIEDLIKQAFLHVEVLGPHVHEGHYDLVASDGEIILPQVWETMIEPGMAVTMHMWPMPEPPPAKESSIDSGTSTSTQSTLPPILSPSSKIEDFDSKSKPEMPVMSARSSPRLIRSPPLSPIFSISLENLKNSPLVKVAEVANSDIPPLNLAYHIPIENSPHLSAVDLDWLKVDDCNT